MSPPDRPPCIAFCCSAKGWGGVQSWILEVAPKLKAHGTPPVVIGDRESPFIDAAREAGLDPLPVAFGADYNPLTIHRFRRLLRERGVEAVILNIDKELRTLGVAAHSLGLPVLNRVGHYQDFKPGSTWQRLGRQWLVDALLIKHESVLPSPERAAWALDLPRHVIANGIDLSPYPEDVDRGVLRDKLGIEQGQIALGMVCRLARHKGFDTVFTAMAELPTSVRLLIAGQGKHEAEIRGWMLEAGVADRVKFLGFRRDLPQILPAFDIYLLPSADDFLPHSILEAMAAGLPIITSDRPGLTELVKNGENGLVQAYGDHGRLTENIQRLVENDDLRIRMGRRSRAIAAAEYDLDRMTDRLIGVVETWIERKKQPPRG